MSYQKMNILGRVGKDPEHRTAASGTTFANFSIAVDGWAKPGEDKKTEWFNCIAFKAKADVVDQYVKKGDLIFVSARMQTRKYEDKNGTERTSVEFIVDELQLIGRTEKRDAEDRDTYSTDGGKPASKSAARAAPPKQEDFDDDIPF